MAKFVKCPRCELNYIREDEEYCDVCKAELGLGPGLVFAIENEKETRIHLCPICKQREISEDQEMCDKCRANLDFKGDQIDYDKDEGWKDFLNDDHEELEDSVSEEEISLSKLAEEEAALDDDFNDEELEADEEYTPADDFEYVDPDDFNDDELEADEDELAEDEDY